MFGWNAEPEIDLEKAKKEVANSDTLHLKQFGEESVQVMLKYYYAPDGSTDPEKTCTFEYVQDTEGIALSRGVVPSSDWNALRAVMPIKASKEKLAQVILDAKRLTELDDMVEHCEVIYEVEGTKTSVRYVTAKAVFPTTARDFLVVTSCEDLPDGSTVIATRSIKLDAIPESGNFVRANTQISGYIIKETSPGECEVTLICHIDLGGYLPATIINLVGVSAPVKLLQNLQKMSEEA